MEHRVLVSTLHFYNNYGSVLQAYALKQTIADRLGYVVDFLPFRPNIAEYKYFTDSMLLEKYKRKVMKFDSFRSEVLGINLESVDSSRELLSILGNVQDSYDAYVVGSDIIWGKEFSGLASPYFLEFADKSKPRIAYAASVILDKAGHTEDDELFKKKLKNFTDIGMRETSSVDTIKQYGERDDVVAVLDPTLLLDALDYESIEDEIADYLGDPYLLSYFLTHDPAVVDYSNMIAKKLGFRIIHYFADYPDRVFPENAKCFAFTGPGEFLSLVRNASMVFTNSFHGTCFSMIYRKPFYTYTAKRNMLSRVKDTVSRLDMESRYFTDFRDLYKVTLEIDYSKFEEQLSLHRKLSIDFLHRSLESKNV